MDALRTAYLHDLARTFRHYKSLGDGAIAQVSDDNLHALVDPDANSVAIVIKHIAGNLRSRFTDFLTSDGEKPGRNRDGEFEMPARPHAPTCSRPGATGSRLALASIEALRPEDLDRTIYVRQEAFLVVEALNRSISHTAYHVGQIVLLAKHFAGPHWTTLSIPKGKSAEAGAYKMDNWVIG